MATALTVGAALAAAAATANNVPIFLGEIGAARADRSGWSQAAEFASLILNSGWAWAAMAVGVGLLVSKGVRPIVGMLVGALASSSSLFTATVVYVLLEALFQGGDGGGRRALAWLVLSFVLGPILGATGAAIRRSGPVGVVAALVIPIGAALNMVVLPPPNESPMATPVILTVWAAAVTAAVVVLTNAARAARVAPGDSARPSLASSTPVRTSDTSRIGGSSSPG